MSTDCKAIDTNEDFSILGVVGTNLFQVYTTNSSGMFVNFYTFPSALGMSYNNRAISLTANGLKAVVISSISSGGSTYLGHYYFIFNRTIN
jgi:hypothetical protein